MGDSADIAGYWAAIPLAYTSAAACPLGCGTGKVVMVGESTAGAAPLIAVVPAAVEINENKYFIRKINQR